MALTDTLRERAVRKGGSAQVDCGELGRLTVEALSPADCARLSDSRSLLYAACRELQMAGETLRSEGKIFRPDEIMAYVTDDEAAAAARTIQELSGLSGDDTALPYEMSGIRLSPVQSFSEAVPEIRPQSVQRETAQTGLPAAEGEIRLSSVQRSEATLTKNGQVSREFAAETDDAAAMLSADKKAQILGGMSSRTAQILVSENGKEYQKDFLAAGGHSDLHEIKSELQRQENGQLHETESELRGSGHWNLHETTSDFGSGRRKLLHETESESSWMMHEIKSELQKGLHEIKSEVREMLHEIESELPEQAAQRLAEGLLRAIGVR